MNKAPDTPVVALLRLVWQQTNKKSAFSWERLNHSMYQAMRLTLGAGFPFAADDFTAVYGEFRGGRWMGDSDEWVYSFAIAEGNPSAVAAFESWKKRQPFIGDAVVPSPVHGGFAHLTGERQRERLHVGSEFFFGGVRRKVTSFADDQQSLTACTYHPPQEGHSESKIRTRTKITREMILADRKERKLRGELWLELLQKVEAGKLTSQEASERLGVKTREDFNLLPVEKIRALLASL